MGSRRYNFYNRAYGRQGYAEEAKLVQDLWLDGRRDEARAAVRRSWRARSTSSATTRW